jgi:hypothetical protein
MKSLADIQNEVCRILSGHSPKLVASKPKKVTVVLIGRHHDDSIAYNIIFEQMQRIFFAGIKMVVCSELPCDTSLEAVIRVQSRDLSVAKELFQLYGLLSENGFKLTAEQQKQFIEKSAHKEVFSKSFSSIVLQLIQGQLYSKICFQIPVLETQLKLYRFLQQNRIPYQGIEFPTSLYSKAEKSFDPNNYHQWFLQWEPLRAPNLATQLRNCIALLKGTGGVVLTENLGLLHVHRVAGLLREQLRENGIDNAEIIATELSPDASMMDEYAFVPAQVKKDLQYYPEDSALFASKDPEHLKQYYRQNPLQTWRWCAEVSASSPYTCPNGEKSVTALIEAHKANSKLYESLTQSLVSTQHDDFLTAYKMRVQKTLTAAKEKVEASGKKMSSVKRSGLLCSAESRFTWADLEATVGDCSYARLTTSAGIFRLK